jgi:hypothetical protein
MSYVSKQITVLVCDLCLRDPGAQQQDCFIMKQFQPNDEGMVLDICMECWDKLKRLVELENR